ncbi:MAG: hypothetical protein ACI4NP_02595 [Thermoguttaceae bacterium]
MSAVTAGEAYVVVTCDTESAKDELYKFSNDVRTAAQRVGKSEKDLSPKANGDGLKGAEDAVNKLKEKVKDAAAYIRGMASSVVSATVSFSNYADSFDKMSQRVGVSSETLSELSYAATLSGTSIERVEESFKGLSQKIVEAVDKGGDAEALFASIGLSTQDLAASSPEEQFYKVADAIAKIDDPTRRAAVAMQVFGESGRELLPLLSGGSAGLNAMRDEARELGATVSTSAASMGAEFGDAITRIKTATDGIKNSFHKALTPALVKVADVLKDVLAFISSMTQRFPTAVSAITAFGVVIGGAAYAVKGLTVAFAAGSAAVKAYRTAIQLLSATNPTILALTALAAAITAVSAAAAYYFSQKRETDVWTDEKNKALEAGEAQREQDMERFHRLEELAAKESLTTSEIAEAARLASILNDTYGEIGVSVDTLTGKINIANGAQTKLNKEMMKNKVQELEAAIKEKNLVGSSRSIDKKIAREMITDDEAKWANRKDFFNGGKFWKGTLYDNLDDKRLAMLADNAEFKARVHAEKIKNYNESKAMQAELDVLRKQLEEPETDEGFETPEEKAKKEEARKKRENAEYDLEYESASTEKKAQMSGAKLQEAEKALQDAKQSGDDEQIAEATRKYMSALRAYESDKGALDRENETKAKEQERQKAEEEEQQTKAKEDRQAAESAYFDQNATLEERWNKSFGELQAAQQELTKAQQGGDDATIAAALRKLTGAQSKFENLDQEVQRQYEQFEEGMAEETTNAIQKKVESTGTFSAYQAQAWGGGLDGQRKLYEENKRQTEYLRRLVDLMGSSSSVFV